MKIVITEQQLKFILNENKLDHFYDRNDINPDDMQYLGSGEYGEAYSIGNDRVLKITTSKSEFKIANEIKNSDSSMFDCFAEIYDTEEVDGKMYIVMEELYQDSEIDSLYDQLSVLLEDQSLPIQYVHYLDLDDVEVSDDLETFINYIEDINHGYRRLGIEASDIQPDNLGYSKDGVLKAFDIDDKNRKSY